MERNQIDDADSQKQSPIEPVLDRSEPQPAKIKTKDFQGAIPSSTQANEIEDSKCQSGKNFEFSDPITLQNPNILTSGTTDAQDFTNQEKGTVNSETHSALEVRIPQKNFAKNNLSAQNFGQNSDQKENPHDYFIDPKSDPNPHQNTLEFLEPNQRFRNKFDQKLIDTNMEKFKISDQKIVENSIFSGNFNEFGPCPNLIDDKFDPKRNLPTDPIPEELPEVKILQNDLDNSILSQTSEMSSFMPLKNSIIQNQKNSEDFQSQIRNQNNSFFDPGSRTRINFDSTDSRNPNARQTIYEQQNRPIIRTIPDTPPQQQIGFPENQNSGYSSHNQIPQNNIAQNYHSNVQPLAAGYNQNFGNQSLNNSQLQIQDSHPNYHQAPHYFNQSFQNQFSHQNHATFQQPMGQIQQNLNTSYSQLENKQYQTYGQPNDWNPQPNDGHGLAQGIQNQQYHPQNFQTQNYHSMPDNLSISHLNQSGFLNQSQISALPTQFNNSHLNYLPQGNSNHYQQGHPFYGPPQNFGNFNFAAQNSPYPNSQQFPGHYYFPHQQMFANHQNLQNQSFWPGNNHSYQFRGNFAPAPPAQFPQSNFQNSNFPSPQDSVISSQRVIPHAPQSLQIIPSGREISKFEENLSHHADQFAKNVSNFENLGSSNFNTYQNSEIYLGHPNPRYQSISSSKIQFTNFQNIDPIDFKPANFDEDKIFHLINFTESSEQNSIVGKFTISEAEFLKFSKLFSPEIGKELIRRDQIEGLMIDFESLKKFKAQFVGAFGRIALTISALVDNQLINRSAEKQFLAFFNKMGTGLFAIPLSTKMNQTLILLVVHTKDENDFDNVSDRRSYIRMLRFLTQLCNTNILGMGKIDIDKIQFKREKETNRHNRFIPQTHQTEKDVCSFGKNYFVYSQYSKFDLVSSGALIFSKKENQAQKKTNDFHYKFSVTNFQHFARSKFSKKSIKLLAVEAYDFGKVHDFLNCFYRQDLEAKKKNVEETLRIIFSDKKSEVSLEIEDKANTYIDAMAIGAIKKFSQNIFELLNVVKNPELSDSIKERLLKTRDSLAFKVNGDMQICTNICSEIYNSRLWKSEVLGLKQHLIKKKIVDEKYLNTTQMQLKEDDDLCQKEADFNYQSPPDKKSSQELIHYLRNLEKIDLMHLDYEKKPKILPVLELIKNNSFWQNVFSFLSDDFDKFLKEIKNEQLELLKDPKNLVNFTREAEILFTKLVEKIKNCSLRNFTEYIEKLKKQKEKTIRENLEKNEFFDLLKSKLEIDQGEEIIKITKIEHSYNTYTKKFEDEFFIDLEDEIIEPGSITFEISKIEPSKEDIDILKKNPDHPLKLKIHYLKAITVPKNIELLHIALLQNGKIGFFSNKNNKFDFEFYGNSFKNDISIRGSFANPAKCFDFSEKFKRFALTYQREKNDLTLVLYGLREDLTQQNEGHIDLSQRFGITEVECIRIYSATEIIVLEKSGSILVTDIRNQTGNRLDIKLGPISNLFVIPNSSCLLIFLQNKIVPYMLEMHQRLADIPINFKMDLRNFTIVQFDSQLHMIYKVDNTLMTQLINCSVNNQRYSLVKRQKKEQISAENDLKSESVLDYFHSLYNRFSILNPMDKFNQKSVSQTLIIYMENSPNFENDCAKIHKKLLEVNKNIQKPGSELIRLAENVKFVKFGENCGKKFFGLSPIQTLDSWVQELICFVPNQIARTENNQLLLMRNGLPMQYDDCDNAYDLQQRISFGLYETLFRNWNKSIKVVTSMGKQSTGKSYTLNHLSGASFDIAAGRCTDGCWMTVKVTDDCLYVMMDFEGLGSLERSEQEDMLLSIFNASISSITLFKTDFSVSRDTESMLSRFNQGANHLKGSDKLFQGIFCIIIKDARENDVEGLIDEYMEKMNAIIKREDKKDFITMMFKNGFDVWPFPSLDLSAYYQETEKLRSYIQDDVPTMFTNGAEFLELMKTILAKIAIQDFTSLSRKDVDLRVHTLERHLFSALHFGTLAGQKIDCKDFVLKSYDRKDEYIPEEANFEIEIGQSENLKISYVDPEIEIDQNNKDLVHFFLNFLPRTHQNHVVWNLAFRKFVKEVFNFRISRVQNWVDQNLQKWNENSEFNDVVDRFKNQCTQKFREFENRGKICQNSCDLCKTSCVLTSYHSGVHTCLQDEHECKIGCIYCCQENKFEKCRFQFGHTNDHICEQNQHTCNAPCRHIRCSFSCQKLSDHQGEHECGQTFHNCPERCSLPRCNAQCQISDEKPHTVHKCVSESCLETCSVPKCGMRCVCNDHFHGSTDLSTKFREENQIDQSMTGFINPEGGMIMLEGHFCGNDHGCPEECRDDGFCQVITERRVTQERFEGRRDQFEYTKKFENIGSKLRCCEKIPAFQLTHPGRHVHTHDPSFIHQCTVRCPTCNNICDKQFGHPGRHNTAHGNMDNCYFVANQEDIDIGDHKYVVGEPSVAEMCHMFCKKLGRGHIHVLPCGKTKEECTPNNTSYRCHESTQYGPDPENSKDEIHHDEYWKIINFEDPCQKIDIETFSKCPYICGSPEHGQDQEPNYCQLGLWHAKVADIKDINMASGYVSSDGHYYNCSHKSQSTGYHFYFCLDDSGSMSGRAWADLQAATADFCNSRSFSGNDLLTIVQFNSTPVTKCSSIKFSQFNSGTHLVFRSGGTCFGPAIKRCHDLMNFNTNSPLIPIFIFMSDGGASDGDKELTNLVNTFNSYGLKTFFIAFGSSLPKLQSMARLAGGTYLTSISGIDLRNTFMQISSKFGLTIAVVPSKK